MRIVCLTGSGPQHRFFLGRIHAAAPEDLRLAVVQARERVGPRGLWRGLRVALAARSLALGFGSPPLSGPRRVRAAARVFGPTWKVLPRDLPVLVTADVNAREVVERVNAVGPDLVLVHGTSLIRRPLMSCGALMLNLHWGLSPWHRGTRCTEWALLRRDFENIGVTIHRLTPRIDGGAIVAQERVALEAEDDVETINMRLTQAGVALVEALLRRLREGGELVFHEQDRKAGELHTERAWGKAEKRALRRMLRRGLGVHLRDGALRAPVPIVRLP